MEDTRMDYEERFMADIMNRLVDSNVPTVEEHFEQEKQEIMNAEINEAAKKKQLILLEKAYEKISLQIGGNEEIC